MSKPLQRESDDALLLCILEEIKRLRHEVRALQPEPRRAGPDATALVLAIAESVGDADFNSAELIGATATDADLRCALGDDVSPRKLGKLLCRVEGEIVSGRKIVRIGNDRSGVIWRVLRV
jgi:hypothetical protein